MAYELKGFGEFMNEKEVLKLRSGEKFSKEDLEQGLLSLHGKEYGRKEIYTQIEQLLGIKINDGSFQKIVDAGVLGKSSTRGKYIFTGTESANSKVANDPKEVNLDDMEVGAGKAKTLAKAGAKKSLKYRIPVSSKSGKFGKFVESVLLNMINTSKGQEKGSLLLKGDPGTGKTSSIEQFADIVGMDIITIEAPHVSEDAIISVPYLVKSGLSSEQKTMQMKESQDIGFEVVSAESALISDLKNKKPMTQANWDKAVNKFKHISDIREQFKRPIKNIRKTYNKILFVDELYRTGSKRIQNLFRTILNGYLGDTPIPKNIYIIFASNMDNTDGSLDEIPLNHQFTALNFDTPSKDDFMAYIGSKFAGAEGEEDQAKVKPEVFNKFMEVLDTEDMGGKDEETGIRVSPRRWEEIIKYVSNGIPPKTQKEAEALVQFVYTNMKNYKEGTQSSKTEKYAQMVRDLVNENSEFNVDAIHAPMASEWENLFSNQIKSKMQLGSDRKYVASLAGKPGVGKTSKMRSLAKEMGAKLIEIDCSTLNSEDVVGLTTPSKKVVTGTDEDGNETQEEILQTKFTAPPLWSKIMNQYDASISIPGSSYTHILFLDEITRASKRVMNSIRSLMLEKKVNANFAIPEDMMIVTALNPTDTGAEELSDHLADVMDIIDVEVKDTELYKYLKFKQENKDANEAIGFDITSKMINIFRELINKLESDTDTDGEEIRGNSKKWYWQWDGNIIYVSPRELDDMISGSIGLVVSKLIDFEGYDKSENYDDSDYLDFIDIIKETIYTKANQLLSFIGEDKHDIDTMAMNNLYEFVKFQIEFETFDEIMDVQSDNVASIKSMVEDSEYNFGEMLDYDELGDVIESYLGSVEPEEAISNISDIIDSIVNDYSATPTKFIDNIVGFYKVLNTVDYTEFSGKISANITQALLQRGLRSYSKSLLKIAIDGNRNFTKEINGHKYYKVLEDLSTRKNYFR